MFSKKKKKKKRKKLCELRVKTFTWFPIMGLSKLRKKKIKGILELFGRNIPELMIRQIPLLEDQRRWLHMNLQLSSHSWFEVKSIKLKPLFIVSLVILFFFIFTYLFIYFGRSQGGRMTEYYTDRLIWNRTPKEREMFVRRKENHLVQKLG